MITQPLELVTGLPGSSKSLTTISRVEEIRKSSGREVYYSGIKDLMLPWTEFDPEKWFELPVGSIIVIDEAQRAYRPSSVSKDPQKWITELETIRHRGYNMVMITQHPMLLHSNVRKLVGAHYHMVRVFGGGRVTMHEFAGVRQNVDSKSGRADSIQHHIKLNKGMFAAYKSAEVHTVKRRIPMRLVLFVVIVLLLPVIAWLVWQRLHQPPGAREVSASPVAAAVSAGVMRPKLSYLEERIPRITGLPATAPIYDEVTRPQVAPKPVACVAAATRCSCYTQQGTKLPAMPDVTCRSIVANGYFDDSPEKDQRGSREDFFAKQERNGQLLAAAPIASRVGAGQLELERGSVRASVPAVGSTALPWVADPNVRQTVTKPR